MDIGVFSKRTILTGAGWTRNWGGRLAEELWQDLIGHRAIQANSRLRPLLLEETSFEVAFGQVQNEPFTDADRDVFQGALLEAFIKMDGQIAPVYHPGVDAYNAREFMFRFGQGCNAGYVFTLNQDLWPERYLFDGHLSGELSASLPGLHVRSDQNLFTSVLGPYSEKLIMAPIREPAIHGKLQRQFNVIKLHGSFNWRAPDKRNTWVLGTNKGGQIVESPLLSWYWDIFKNVLSAGM